MQIRTLLGAVSALALTALAVFGLATPALAAYGPQSGSATASATSVANGGSVTVGGHRFCPGSRVTVTASQGGEVYLMQKVRASSHGDVSATLTLTETGTNTITLTGRQSNCSGTRVLGVKVGVHGAVAGVNAGSATGLPGTGGVNFTPLWAGLGLLAAGTILVSAARSRRRILV